MSELKNLNKRVTDGFAAADEKFDFLAMRLLAVEEKVEKCATNDRVNKLEAKMLFMFDQQGVILQRLDQERVFNEQRIKRIEEKIGA